ncbi:MAG: DUF3343 domain-containing protein [Oscillospiraceae bacterium]|nr:DUF3343 domain-containing protein [Oscillospiraceae bacterium]
MFYDTSYHSMISCMVACRSVTYAQKYSKLLRKHGLSAYTRKLPSHLANVGCGHAVSVRPGQVRTALALLGSYGAGPFRVFCEGPGGTTEEMTL